MSIGPNHVKELLQTERRYGTLATDNLIETRIKEVSVIPFPVFNGYCMRHPNVYAPSFAIVIDTMFFRFLCGHCITDFTEALRKQNQSFVFFDTRKYCYN